MKKKEDDQESIKKNKDLLARCYNRLGKIYFK